MIAALPATWFDKAVTVFPHHLSVDAGGGVVETFTANTYTTTMRFNSTGGSENNSGGGIRTTGQFTIYAPGNITVNSSDRIQYGDRIFDVLNVSDFDEAGVYLKITAVEVGGVS